MPIELRGVAPDDHQVLRLAAAMSAELIGRQAHADTAAAEHRTAIADSVGDDGEILLAMEVPGKSSGCTWCRPTGAPE